MDFAHMSRLLLSVAIFAPGLVVLTFLAFVGMLVTLEKAGVFWKGWTIKPKKVVEAPSNPRSGPLVAALTDAIAEESVDESRVQRG